MIDVAIKGSLDQTVQITPGGALCVQLGQHNLIEQRLLADTNAVNFFKPRPFNRFVIDGIIVNADKNVTGSALVTIFEATSDTETTVAKSIIVIDILKNDTTSILNINAVVDAGIFINGKSDDFNIAVTILGFYEKV